jgi:hypothetical protein
MRRCDRGLVSGSRKLEARGPKAESKKQPGGRSAHPLCETSSQRAGPPKVLPALNARPAPRFKIRGVGRCLEGFPPSRGTCDVQRVSELLRPRPRARRMTPYSNPRASVTQKIISVLNLPLVAFELGHGDLIRQCPARTGTFTFIVVVYSAGVKRRVCW